MASIVFDIETIGVNYDELSEDQKNYLHKRDETDEDREETKGKLGLFAPFCNVVTIAMANPHTGKGKVYFSAGDQTLDSFEEDGAEFICGNEKQILQMFWDDIKHFDQVISFNGRGFDGPVLMLRSAIHGIKSTKNLVPYRYDHKTHCDLLDQMTFYGASRKYNLDTFTRAFGITSPKEAGMSGDQVRDQYAQGNYVEIAKYCWGDVKATSELWKKWDAFMKF